MDHGQRGSYSLDEYAGDVVRIVCERCGRRGQYRKETLLARYGADIVLPHLLRQIAQCERWDNLTGGCGTHYDLRPGDLPGSSPPRSRA